MAPGPYDEDTPIVGSVLLDGVIDSQSAVVILGIEPADDIEDGVRHIGEVLQHVLALPVLVVGAVLDELVPGRYFIVEVLLVDVGNRPELEEEPVSVGRGK